MAATMEDVARMAGVSTATVSRVLNTPELVSETTRTRVMDAIERLDYKINVAARRLRTAQTRTIAVLIPTIAEPVINQVVEAVEDVAITENYSLLMCSTRGLIEREQAYIQLITQAAAVDGVLYISPRSAPDQVLQLTQGSAPLVLCNYSIEDHDIPSILVDHASSVYQTTRYLLTLGHRRIALLNLAGAHYYPALMRHQGYERAFSEAGLVPDPTLIKEINQPTYDNDEWRAVIQALLDLPHRPTAFVAFNDAVALQVYAVCRARGLGIPHDISVTGCDDILSSRYVEPPLTTVDISAADQGHLAMRYLLALMTQSQPDFPRSTLLPVNLIVRESCAAPAG